jgi:hypothetical protein
VSHVSLQQPERWRDSPNAYPLVLQFHYYFGARQEKGCYPPGSTRPFLSSDGLPYIRGETFQIQGGPHIRGPAPR